MSPPDDRDGSIPCNVKRVAMADSSEDESYWHGTVETGYDPLTIDILFAFIASL
jgi:hypothetical protein